MIVMVPNYLTKVFYNNRITFKKLKFVFLLGYKLVKGIGAISAQWMNKSFALKALDGDLELVNYISIYI